MRRWMFLNGVLAVIVLGLGVQIVRTWLRTLPPVEVRAAGKPTDPPTRAGEGGKRKRGQGTDKAPQTPVVLVTAIVAKDLFDPSRQKATEETKTQTVVHEVNPPPGISLVGVRIYGDDREGFILDATQSNTQRRIRSGDAVGNFKVKAIHTNNVLLVSDAGDEVTLKLEVEKGKVPGAPGAPGGPGRPGAKPGQPGAPGGPASPAAGVMAGQPTSAGIGAVKPPVTAAGVVATPPVPPTTAPPGSHLPAQPAQPNLPEGVREKLEQMKKGLHKR